VEDAGGIVVQSDFKTDKVDALSQYLPGYPPIFLINKNIPTDRMRFTLAHEIGHIIMHRLPTEDMEREADRFAAEFLMPEEQIRPQLAFVNLPKLASLKPYWRVSMNSLLYRAAEIGTIDARRKSYLWMMMGKAGYRKSEPGHIPPETPMAVAELIQLHSTSLGYTHDEIGRVLCEPASFMEFRSNRSEGGLRLVR
jgi:Zn-dependent peptidase ImmA (M78 family)